MDTKDSFWNTLSRKVQHFIEQRQLFTHQDRILVAVSGGPDSMYLAHVLHYLGYQLGLAHVNYQLRGADSEREAELIQTLSDQWNLPVWIRTFDTKVITSQSEESLQMVARELRYTFFDELLENEQFDVCATAHHADDDLETILLSLIKGNQFDIFYRIPGKRDNYVRPLLHIYKEEILKALQDAGISFSIDYTNLENLYQRNRVRNVLLPTIAEINPNYKTQLIKRIAWYKQQMEFLKQVLSTWYERCVSESEGNRFLNERPFAEHFSDAYLEVFYAYVLMRWEIHGHLLWEGVSLVSSMPGKQVELKDGRSLYRTRSGLELISSEVDTTWVEIIEDFEGEVQIEVNSRHKIHVRKYNNVNKSKLDPTLLFMDMAKVEFPILLRHWRVGDKMIPFGMKNEKKLSDIFIDQKYPTSEKQRAVVIESRGQIIGVLGFRISERVKIEESTKEVLIIGSVQE